MADISLRAYQDELDRLLREEKYDEVIAHARHILKSQPKNLRAYQQLGDALVASARWEEATDVLARTLGAQPQDFNAHSQLARAFQHLGNYDRAIWHAERALDQMPGDQDAIALIRELYRAHRNEEIDRLQLTTAALAQQHIRGNLLTEALSTLATALERSPNRVDLQLLRARALWLDGQRMDAAETALDILERLPYVIEANRIMTELWLAEQRPSDAQLYLKRIEDLDPYLASQMATGEEAPENLLMMDRLDYSAAARRDSEIVNPEWLDSLGETDGDAATTVEESGGLGALLGIGGSDQAPDDQDVTADLDDLLSDEQIEQLFSELVIGEPVAEVSEALPADDEAAEILNVMEAQGFIDETASPADASEKPQRSNESDDLVNLAAQAGAPEADAESTQADDARAELDGDLADLLEQLDSAEENGDWMADIQGESLALEGDDESQEYLDDFEREWVKAGGEEEGGAPWLSAAMREAMDQPDGDLDVFGGDDQLQKLLSLDSDTEPLHLSDIEDWLTLEPDGDGAEDRERFPDIEDEMLHSPPGTSWLDDDEATEGDSLLRASDERDSNQLNAALIEGWGAELDDDDDDDPYVDWLRDDPNELNDEELGILSAPAAVPSDSSAEERARAWGLDDPNQLADFVDSAGGSEGAPDWLNAVVPGLDRENDAATNDADEYARPMSAPGKEFAWVSDLVDEETGQMEALDPDQEEATPYFRFTNPPAWLKKMNERAGGGAGEGMVTAVKALSLDEDIEALELDDLTFDDYFSFDTPTDKLDAISLDEDTQKLSLVGLDWDDYFDLESPTEKTIAITLDEDADDLDFAAIGVDDADFDFETPMAETLESGGEFNFDDIGLADDRAAGADQETAAPPAWLNYDGLEGDNRDADDPNRDRAGGKTTL